MFAGLGRFWTWGCDILLCWIEKQFQKVVSARFQKINFLLYRVANAKGESEQYLAGLVNWKVAKSQKKKMIFFRSNDIWVLASAKSTKKKKWLMMFSGYEFLKN